MVHRYYLDVINVYLFLAHPVIDEKTGDLYYASTNQAAGSVAGGQPFLDLGVVDNTGVLYKLFHIPIRNGILTEIISS